MLWSLIIVFMEALSLFFLIEFGYKTLTNSSGQQP